MLTSLETYFNAGRCAAQALNRDDAFLFEQWRTWKHRALRLETADDALKGERAYDDGYRAARHVPRPEGFR